MIRVKWRNILLLALIILSMVIYCKWRNNPPNWLVSWQSGYCWGRYGPADSQVFSLMVLGLILITLVAIARLYFDRKR